MNDRVCKVSWFQWRFLTCLKTVSDIDRFLILNAKTSSFGNPKNPGTAASFGMSLWAEAGAGVEPATSATRFLRGRTTGQSMVRSEKWTVTWFEAYCMGFIALEIFSGGIVFVWFGTNGESGSGRTGTWSRWVDRLIDWFDYRPDWLIDRSIDWLIAYWSYWLTVNYILRFSTFLRNLRCILLWTNKGMFVIIRRKRGCGRLAGAKTGPNEEFGAGSQTCPHKRADESADSHQDHLAGIARVGDSKQICVLLSTCWGRIFLSDSL